jgi:hypothetical protein
MAFNKISRTRNVLAEASRSIGELGLLGDGPSTPCTLAGWRRLNPTMTSQRNERQIAYEDISKLEQKLARVAATNLEELLLKACYVDDFPWNFPGDHIAESIVRGPSRAWPQAKGCNFQRGHQKENSQCLEFSP